MRWTPWPHVSISVEKPILWRQKTKTRQEARLGSLNLSREATPLATKSKNPAGAVTYGFQSQSRSQSSGDLHIDFQVSVEPAVSISVEKPILWRLDPQKRGKGRTQVSISVEKPILWRPEAEY